MMKHKGAITKAIDAIESFHFSIPAKHPDQKRKSLEALESLKTLQDAYQDNKGECATVKSRLLREAIEDE